MKNPQSLAAAMTKFFRAPDLKTVADKGCCAFVLMWCLGIDCNDIKAIKKVREMLKKNVIEPDCTVKWFSATDWLCPARPLDDVLFRDISSIKDIQERTPVMYQYGKKCHWVGVEHGRIAFNPLSYSQCVALGKPVEKRVLIFKEKI